MKIFVLTAVTAFFTLDCAHKKTNPYTSYQEAKQMTENQDKYYEIIGEEGPQSKTYTYSAGGCLWGTKRLFRQIHGAPTTEVGYANGNYDKAPTCEQVCEGNTNLAKTVKAIYDPQPIGLYKPIDPYFKTTSPTSLDKQGSDRGTQYRTSIYYTDVVEKPLIERAIHRLAAQYIKPIVVEVLPSRNFYKAEEHHQTCLDKNPNGHCHISPAIFELVRKANPVSTKHKRLAESESRKPLTPEQYTITQESAAERPLANEY